MTPSHDPDRLPSPFGSRAELPAADTLRFNITVAADDMIRTFERLATMMDALAEGLASEETRVWRLAVASHRWLAQHPTDDLDDATWWRLYSWAMAAHYRAVGKDVARPSTAVAIRPRATVAA